MKKALKLRIALTMALMVAGLASVWGQVSNPLTVNGVTMSENGTNSSGAAAGTETPDLITKGTTVPYLVIPDEVLNPSWDESDPANTTTVTSTWSWSGLAGIGAINGTSNKQYILLDVTGNVGTGTISVQENNNVTCPGSTTSINVQIIAAPATTALTSTLANFCTPTTATVGDLNVNLPVYDLGFTTSAPGTALVKVKATLTYTPFSGAGSDLFTNSELNVAADGTITLPITQVDNWGTYTLSIASISDKISRKDATTDATSDLGYFPSVRTLDFVVYKTPATGVIYHVPNN